MTASLRKQPLCWFWEWSDLWESMVGVTWHQTEEENEDLGGRWTWYGREKREIQRSDEPVTQGQCAGTVPGFLSEPVRRLRGSVSVMRPQRCSPRSVAVTRVGTTQFAGGRVYLGS